MQGVLPAGGRPAPGRVPSSGRAKTYADPDYGYTSIGEVGGVFLLGIGSLAARRRADVRLPAVLPEYFRGETLPKRDAA